MIRNFLLYAGLNRQDYEDSHEEIFSANRRMISIFSIVATVVMAVLVLSSFFSSFMAVTQAEYAVVLVCNAAIAIFAHRARFEKVADWGLMQATVYIFVGILMIMGIAVSMAQPDQQTASFIAFLLATPLMVIDVPWRMNTFIAFFMGVFYCFVFRYKTGDVLRADLINVTAYGLFSIVINTVMTRIKMDSYRHSRLALVNQRLEQEMRYQKVLMALTLEYATVIRANLETDEMEILKMSERALTKLGKVLEGCSFSEARAIYLTNAVLEEDQAEVAAQTSVYYLKEHLSWPDIMTITYRNSLGRYGEEKTVRVSEDTVIIGFADRDKEIREKLRNAEELRQAKIAAEEANQAKSAFLFNMSHDIRTPMNAIVGFTDVALLHQDDPAMVGSSLHKIHQASGQLLALINDILDMSRIESGKLEIHPEPVSMKAILDNMASIFSGPTDEKGLHFVIDSIDIRHDAVIADRKVIDRILLNLISNSVKFTDRGGSVSVRVSEVSGDGQGSLDRPISGDGQRSGDGQGSEDRRESMERRAHAKFRLVVQDTGIGMSKEFISKIFEPFERERSSTVSNIQGTGLGMSIVKKLVDAMEGSIIVESEQGRGSCFTVEIPLETTDAVIEEADNSQAIDVNCLKGKRILLVEDVEVNREIAGIILTDNGMEVDEAENGQIALERFQEDPDRYDVILMDIQMPVMNGYEATRAIRALPAERAVSIPIIAMTANAFEQDRRNALEAGMNGHVAKPIDIKQLLTTLADFV